MTLRSRLIKQGKIKWLDVGNGNKFEDGFFYLDQLPINSVPKNKRKLYNRINLLKISSDQIKKLGKFDLVRMQHTLEHFSFEEGQQIISFCAKVLKKNGVLLITTPDLKINIKRYLNNSYKSWKKFNWWAHKRIPKNSPNSFYFSIFAYSMPWQSHKWIYDFEGLKYQVLSSKHFKQIKELKKNDTLASIPFTHNRPEEDVCLMAVRK